MIDCNKGKVALGHNGNLTNAAEWRRKLEHRGSIFQTNSDTEVIVHMIARSQARNLSGAIGDALNQVEGAYSLLVLTPDELYAVRDPRGFRPLDLGKLGRLPGWWRSETCAFDLLNAQYVREVEPGEMVRISRSGIESIRFAPAKPQQHCVFEHVYFSRPDSIIFGRSVNESREAPRPPARARASRRRRHRRARPGLRRSRRGGLRARIRNPFPHGPDPQSLHRPHVHRAFASHSQFRREAEAQSRFAA